MEKLAPKEPELEIVLVVTFACNTVVIYSSSMQVEMYSNFTFDNGKKSEDCNGPSMRTSHVIVNASEKDIQWVEIVLSRSNRYSCFITP